MVAYYLVTVVFMLFVPFFLTYNLSNLLLLLSTLSLKQTALLILAVCFVVMALYGYFATKIRNQNHKSDESDSMKDLYLPVFIPMIWFLLCAGISNILNLSYGFFTSLVLAVLTQNLWGALGMGVFDLAWLDHWHAMLVMSLVYYFVLILGFAVGERITSRDMNVLRKPFRCHKKFITISLLVVFLIYSLSEFVLFLYQKNILPTPPFFPQFYF